MRFTRIALGATLVALGLGVLPVPQAGAAVAVSGPSLPPGTFFGANSELHVANDSGVLVGEVDHRLTLWKGGRTTVLTDIGGQVNAINASGWFTGSKPVTEGGATRFTGVVWNPDGVATDITPPQGSAASVTASGRAIADDGTVALDYSHYTTAGSVRQFALWRAGVLTPLPLGERAQFAAMNNRGEVVAVTFPSAVRTATKCTASGACAPLPELPGTITSEATAINDAGVVVGRAEVRVSPSEIRTVAVVWRDGTATALPMPPGATQAAATVVNETGLIGGSASAGPSSSTSAVLWRDGAVEEPAAGLPRDTHRLGIAGINDAGEVVGVSVDKRNPGTEVRRGFLWRDGVLTTLEPVLPLGEVAVTGITDSGLIIGISGYSSPIPLFPAWSRATTWKINR